MYDFLNASSAVYRQFFSASLTAASDDTLLIRQGYLLSMTVHEEDQPFTDILVRTNQIVKIGKNPVAPDAKVIDARGKKYVMPGFVDAHNHLWVTTMRGQFRNKQGKFFPVRNKLAMKTLLTSRCINQGGAGQAGNVYRLT